MRSRHTFDACCALACTLVLGACDNGSGSPPSSPAGIANVAPSAAAGGDLTAVEGATVQLDGSASHDPDGAIQSYSWRQTEGAAITLSASNSPNPSFVAPPVLGNLDHIDLRFALMVTDDGGLVDQTEVAVRVFDANRRPLVSITGAPASAVAGATVNLDASGSSDPDGVIASYLWQQKNGTAGEIQTPDSAEATLLLPIVSEGELIAFAALVTDDEGKIGVGTVEILVQPEADTLAFVDFAAATSVEVDTIWPALRVEVLNSNGERIQRGPPAAFDISLEVQSGSGAVSGTLTRQAFQGIAVFNDLAYHVVEDGMVLRAHADGGAIEGLSPTINVVLTNTPPNVSASASDLTVDALSTGVQLLGTAGDPDGSIVRHLWSQLSGPAVVLTDANTATATFAAPEVKEPTELTFRYTATDNGGKQKSDQVTILVNPVAAGVALVATLKTPVAKDGVWPGVEVEIQNSAGERITAGAAASYLVHLAVQTGEPSLLSGTTDVMATAGVATFADLAYEGLADTVVLVPSVVAPPLTGAPSSPVAVRSKLPGAIGASGASVWFTGADAATNGETFFTGGFRTAGTNLDFGFAATAISYAAAGHHDGFVARYAGDGGLAWVRTFGGADATAQVVDVTTTTTGSALVVARVAGLVDFDDSAGELLLPVFGNDDVAVASLMGDNGDLEWAVSFGGAASEHPVAVDLYVDGGDKALVAGEFTGTAVDFEPCSGSAPASSNGFFSAFVVMLATQTIATGCASLGATEWLYAPTAIAGDSAVADLHVVGAGIYVVGNFSGSIEFESGAAKTPVAGATASAFVMKLDPATGDPVWIHTFGGDAGATTAEAVASDNDGNLYIAGTFRGGGDFAPGAPIHTLSSSGEVDSYVISLSAAGAFRPELALSFGGSGTGDTVAVEALAVGPNPGDPLVVTGAIWGSVDVDPDVVTSNLVTARPGESNGFVLGLTPTGLFDFVYQNGATAGTLGLDTRYGALVVSHPAAGLTLTASGRAGGIQANYDVDPTAAVRTLNPAGNLDATLAVITP